MNKTRRKKEPPKIHVCFHCGTAFSRPYRLKQHEKLHENVKEFVCGEPNCNKSYTNKSHLDRHIYSVHIESAVNVIYSCPECMKVYVNRQNLNRHMKTYHAKKTVFTCDVCSTNFNKKHQLSAHMYDHTFVKSFSCELCRCEFITLLEKKKHMKHHKTYSCDLCSMAFVQWSKYRKHKKMMHTEYQCDDCGRKFNKRVHMVHHTKVHITRYTPTFYPCTYENCDRVYTRNSNLKQHIKMKHLKAKHECQICSTSLSTKAKLLLHLKTHLQTNSNILQPTKKDGRKERHDQGALKTSTALRIAGLVVDPENENIRGTLKSITDLTTEHKGVSESDSKQNGNPDANELDTANSATEQNGIADSATTQSTIDKTDSAPKTDDGMELSFYENVDDSLKTILNNHETQKLDLKENSMQQKCEFNVS